MLSITYISTAVYELDEQELLALLRQSRAKNAALGITGLLQYRAGNFIQTLEGPAPTVLNLMTSICRDSRHKHVVQITREPIPRRVFPCWSMAFQPLHTLPQDLAPAFSELQGDMEMVERFALSSMRSRRLHAQFIDNLRVD